MVISSLRTSAFRNLADNEVSTNAQDVFLIGNNGQGKTNFLEAIYYCCYGSSFRAGRDGDIARNGNSDFSASAKIKGAASVNEKDVLLSEILIKAEKNKKTVFLDGKRVEYRKELLNIAP